MALDLETQLINNLKYFLDTKFLDEGLFFNVASSQVDFQGVDQSKLSLVSNDPDFLDGQVYQSQYKNWVYEEDIAVPSGFIGPTLASGVFVNSVFHPRIDLVYGHSIDYPGGRIIFDDETAVVMGDLVQAAFGVRRVQVEETNNDIIPLINDLLVSNPEIAAPHALPSGIHLPAVYIERARGTSRGLALGGGKITTREINFHILTKHANDIKPISFTLSELEDTPLELVNWDTAPQPLDEFGDKTSGYTPFKTLQSTTRLNGLYFTRMESRNFPIAAPLNIEIVEGEAEIRRKDA